MVTINRGLQAAVYTTWQAFSAQPEVYHLRRFVQNPGPVGVVDAAFAAPTEPLNYAFTRNDGWSSWIPNTQELHYLGQIKLTGAVKEGQTWRLNADSAEDFGYDAAKLGATYGNIYNNAGTTFYLYALPSPHKEDGTLFVPKSDQFLMFVIESTGGKNFRVTRAGGAQVHDLVVRGGKLAAELKASPGQDGLYLDHWGILAGGDIRPGDDLKLNFNLGAQVATGPRLAVYDKKSLWRANLYIDEGGQDDWNNRHPWVTENEWNREMRTRTAFLNNQTVGLNNLPVGDGGQVVQFPAYSAVRDIGSPLANTVAYSYPAHRYESDSGWTSPVMLQEGLGTDGLPTFSTNQGNAGSMDSPFDYIWKMRRQGFSASGNNWWNYTVTKPGDGAISANLDGIRYIPSLGLYLSMPKHTLNVTKPATDTQTPDTWDQAPYDGVGNSPELLQNPNTYELVVQKRRNASWIIEAGTDCVGFAQRAANWPGSPYKWVKLPPGMMEYNSGAGTTNPYTAMNEYGKNNQYRNYPKSEAELSTGYVAYDIISKNSEIGDQSETSTQAHLSQLKRVVPGDIWVKENSKSITKTAHIAIVASVPINAASYTDPLALMNDIILIEGEFTNKIQSVIKRLSVGDYNNGNITSDRVIYPTFSVKAGGLNLNCKSWAIRRLR